MGPVLLHFSEAYLASLAGGPSKIKMGRGWKGMKVDIGGKEERRRREKRERKGNGERLIFRK